MSGGGGKVCDASASFIYSVFYNHWGDFIVFLGRLGKRIQRVTPFFTPALLPLTLPISSCSSRPAGSIMYVHIARFSSRTFSIIFPVNSLAATISLLHVFAGGGAPSALALLMQSLHQQDARPL